LRPKFGIGMKKSVTWIDHDKYVWDEGARCIRAGKLRSLQGRPRKVSPLVSVVGEHLPFASILDVQRHLCERTRKCWQQLLGVYMIHDKKGVVRYAGKGMIFGRLRSHKKKYGDKVTRFSFYLIPDRRHRDEIETLMLRGLHLTENKQKNRTSTYTRAILSFCPGIHFYQFRGKAGQ